MSVKKKKRRNSGQSIIEVLAAFALLSFLLTGIVIIGLYAIRNTQYSRNKSLATKLATQQMERARVLRDAAGIGVLPSCSSPCYIDTNLTITPKPYVTGMFTQSVKVLIPVSAECPTPTAVAAATIYKTVVDVAWDGNPTKYVEFSSCFSDWR